MIPVALIFSCVAVGTLYTIMSWALVSVYGTNTDWSKVANAGNTAVINGKTVPVDYDNFVLGPVSAAGRRVLARRAQLPDHHGLAGLRRCAHERGPALHVRDGPRGAAAALPRQDAPGAQVAVHGRADLGCRGRRAVPALPGHEPHGPGRLLLALAAGRDLDRARAGADGALGVHVLPARASRASSRGRRPCARGSASPARSSCSRSSTTTRRSWQRAPRSTSRSSSRSAPGRARCRSRGSASSASRVPVASLGYAYTIRRTNPEKYALMGRFVNESA